MPIAFFMCARSHSLQDSILFETVCDLQEPFFILGFHAGQSPSLNLIEMILAFDIGGPKNHINTFDGGFEFVLNGRKSVNAQLTVADTLDNKRLLDTAKSKICLLYTSPSPRD